MIESLLLTAFYIYYCYQLGDMENGKVKVIVLALVILPVLFLGEYFKAGFIAWPLITLGIFLFSIFYDREGSDGKKIFLLLPGIEILLCPSRDLLTAVLAVTVFLVLSGRRGYLRLVNGGLVVLLYLFLELGIIRSWILPGAGITAMVLLFILLEGTLKGYELGFLRSSQNFQQELLQHQYEEIKSIYLDMRGWRHDYHNHIQVLKAHMDMEQNREAREYLNQLEQDLDSVDEYVKSGNLMIDAILNSKLTQAREKEIRIHCKAEVTGELAISDIDLCVILGNLIENAMEACEKIEAEKRFLRIYMVIHKSQLYISIQNSAKEDLDFNEKHYITTKRGNHGFGMKRVKMLVDEYGGYLNLQNEPGIFAAEVTLPVPFVPSK